MKKALCAILLFALLLTATAAHSEAEVAPLGHESTVFSMDTAKYAMRIAAAQNKKDATALFAGMDFTVLRQEHYNKPITDHSHTSAYTVAAGEASVRGESRTLIAITIRGTDDGEWYSNFDFAAGAGNDCAYAENFYEAAQDIFASAKQDIDRYESPVVLVTGYSRGAACANLLGVLLDEAYGEEDVYVYTFATPNTMHTASTDYPNIFNLVNMNDAVTRLPVTGWGFSRAGVDIELRDPQYVNADMHEMFLSLLGVCPDIASYYNDRHSLTGYGLSDDGITFFELFQAMASMFTEGADKTEAKALFQRVIATPNDMTVFFVLFTGTSEAGDTNSTNFFSQHDPQIYISLMKAYQE